jgi:hypothetical protein
MADTSQPSGGAETVKAWGTPPKKKPKRKR